MARYCFRVKEETFKEYAVEADSEGQAEDEFARIRFENEDPGRTVHTNLIYATLTTEDSWEDEWWRT